MQVADECNSFYVVFWNQAIKEYLPIFEQNLHGWVSIEDFSVNFYLGEPSVKLVEKTAEIRAVVEKELLDKLNLPERVVQAIEAAKGLNVRGHIVHIDGSTFRRWKKCGKCKGKYKYMYIYIEILCFYVVSVGMGADPVCNARDCKKFNVTKVITKNTKLKFNAFLKQQRMPFVFFVDTEPMLIPRDQFDSDGF